MVRVQAEPRVREFGHVGTADDDRAGRAQPAYDNGIVPRWWRVIERAGTRAGDMAGLVEQVLDRNRNTRECRQGNTGLTLPVDGVGTRACRDCVDLEEGGMCFAALQGAIQRLLDQFTGRAMPGGQFGAPLRDRMGEQGHRLIL